MTPMMNLFLRFVAALVLAVLMLSLSDYALAANPLPEGAHNVLDTMGPQAGHILDLWRVFLYLCCAVFALILLALLYFLRRQPRGDAGTPPELGFVDAPEPAPRRHVTRAVIASTLGLVALIVASVFTDRALARLPLTGAVNIDVTGHQWWWTARYRNGGPDEEFNTANELVVPVGKPVIVNLKSDDVIHSMWLPNLAGKKDLIPGRSASLQFRADKPGVYRGQCVEFCGLQHAQMTLHVFAVPQEQFDAWVQGQRQPAAEPADPRAQRGKQLFQSVSCAMCHAVQGTLAGAQRGPDLTHVASRKTLAAGALPNTPEDLAAWIRNPQLYKPGSSMPATPLSQEDLDAIVAYLGGLK